MNLVRCCACGTSGTLHRHLRVAGTVDDQGLIPTTDQFGTALADIVRCGACGHSQLECFPPNAVLETAYGDATSEDYIREEHGQRETARRLLVRLEAWCARGPLLDVGCWTGFLMAEAQARGWEPLGLELSAFASTYARERLGLDVRTTGLRDVELPAEHFQAVVMADVLEHLTDPGDALARVARGSMSGGALCLAVPDAGSRLARAMGRRWWSILPTHMQYFTRGSLTTLLHRQGWEVVEVTTAPKAFTVRYYVGRLEGYSPPLARSLESAARALGAAERLWAPDFRDRMLVIARKAPATVAERQSRP